MTKEEATRKIANYKERLLKTSLNPKYVEQEIAHVIGAFDYWMDEDPSYARWYINFFERIVKEQEKKSHIHTRSFQ